jgi:hypothetical protein
MKAGVVTLVSIPDCDIAQRRACPEARSIRAKNIAIQPGAMIGSTLGDRTNGMLPCFTLSQLWILCVDRRYGSAVALGDVQLLPRRVAISDQTDAQDVSDGGVFGRTSSLIVHVLLAT